MKCYVSQFLSGSLPTEVGSLAALTHLFIGSTMLSRKLPTEIGRLTTLNYLRFDNTLISC